MGRHSAVTAEDPYQLALWPYGLLRQAVVTWRPQNKATVWPTIADFIDQADEAAVEVVSNPLKVAKKCPQGIHPWNDDNIVIEPNGSESCNLCVVEDEDLKKAALTAFTTDPGYALDVMGRARQIIGKREAQHQIKPEFPVFVGALELPPNTNGSVKSTPKYDFPVVIVQEAIRPAKAYCRHGHEWTEENTEINSQGSKVCKACRRTRQKRYQDSKKTGPPVLAMRRSPVVSPEEILANVKQYNKEHKMTEVEDSVNLGARAPRKRGRKPTEVCRNGHPREGNTHIGPGGKRTCTICQAASQRRFAEKNPKPKSTTTIVTVADLMDD